MLQPLADIDHAVASEFAAGDRARAAALGLLSWAARQGCSGLPLAAIAAGEFDLLLAELPGRFAGAGLAAALREQPERERGWLREGDWVCLPRLARLESELAARLAARIGPRPARDADVSGVDELAEGPQRDAIVQALHSRFSLICGGPGTGKTWTAARLLQCLLRRDGRELRIALAAPTGKAAARLSESIAADWPADLPQPAPAQTVHRLLGIGGEGRPRFDADNPLPVDVLLVDEASMLDLVLSTQLLRALPARARLILLGDPEQLPAVEGGGVLAELVAAGATFGFVQRLQRPHRFTGAGGLPELLAAVRAGDGGGFRDAAAAASASYAAGPELQRDDPRLAALARGFAALTQGSPAQRLLALQRLRVLCARRYGPGSVAAINAAIAAQRFGARPPPAHYDGQPLLIERNAASLDLWNGDLGVVVAEPSGALRAWFSASDGSPRALRLDVLPEHATAYAMTVHKAQGSEFDEVVVCFAAEDARWLGRQWLYTALSRARTSVQLWADAAATQQVIGRDLRHYSRLAARLGDCLERR